MCLLAYRRDGEKEGFAMKDLKVWKFENKTVRTVEMNGEPWFVGREVAEILGYSNASDALLKHVDDEDRQSIQKSQNAIFDIPKRGLVIINESGIYSLILSSKLPKAKRFKRWVTSEVLPTIRKHGMYATEELLNNPDFAIAAFKALRDERNKNKKLSAKMQAQKKQIAVMQPKASYYDVVLQCKDLVPVNTIAKDYGWSAIRLNAYLHEHGIQYKQGEIWHLYQDYADKGYTSTRTQIFSGRDGEQHTREHTYWTQKGRLFLYEYLKADGILPAIEREKAVG